MKTKELLIPLRGLNQNDALPQRADGGMEVLHQLTWSDGGSTFSIGDGCNLSSDGCNLSSNGCNLSSDGCNLSSDGGNLSSDGGLMINSGGWTEGGLMGVGLAAVRRAAMGSGYSLKGEHRTEAYHHLLLERQTGNTYHYAWTDAGTESTKTNSGTNSGTDSGTGSSNDTDSTTVAGTEGSAPHPIILPDDSRPVNSMVSVGDILCFVYDDDTLYALWQPDASDYAVVTRSQLGYDLLIGQDQQQHVIVTHPVDSRLRSYLAAPEAPLRSQPTVAVRLFGESYTTAESFATNATLIRAAAESALDQTMASNGNSLFKHIVFGITVLRLFDGSALHYSPIFSLLPAEVSDTLEVDGDTLKQQVWLHRHTLRATLHHSSLPSSALVQGLDVYLSEPVTFTALHTPSQVERDTEGHVTRLTFPYLDLAHTEALYRRLTFRHALRISASDFGGDVLLHPASANAPALDLSDMGHLRYGARHAFVFGRRLHLADVTSVLGSPFTVRLRYRYATLSPAERRSGIALAGEWLCGERPDTADRSQGTTAELVVRASTDGVQQQQVVFRGQVAYPLPGALQMASRHLTWLEAHLRVELDGAVRYYRLRTSVLSTPGRDLSDAAYTTAGGAHRSGRPAFHSLLLQQVRSLVFDDVTGTYGWSYDLWTEEGAADYETVASQARWQWPLERRPSTLLWTAEGTPLVTGESSQTTIGGGRLHSVTPCTRRTASNLIGEYPLYALADDGIWALRLEKDFRWQARQPVSPTTILPGTEAVTTADSMVFLGERGVMQLKGTRLVCLSEALGQRRAAYWSCHRLLYDAARHYLLVVPCGEATWAWLYHTDSGVWSTVSLPYSDLRQMGDAWWGKDGKGADTAAVQVEMRPAAANYSLATRPFTLDARRRLCTLRGVSLTGTPRAVRAAHLVVEGSHDGGCWHPVCQSPEGRVWSISGSGHRWFRVLAEGRLEAGERLSEIRLTYIERKGSRSGFYNAKEI